MPTILIGGYYGAGNVGDEAILEAIVTGLRKQRTDLSLFVTSWNPEKTSADLNVEAFHWKDIDALLNAAQKSDLILLGGGGIFHDLWGFDPQTYLRKGFWDISAFGSLPLLAELLDIPCMICAVGVGPLNTPAAKEHTRLAFERCQVATVRDAESVNVLTQTGLDINNPQRPIHVLPDIVFSLSPNEKDKERASEILTAHQLVPGTKILGLSLLYWDIGIEPETWMDNTARGIKTFLLNNPDFHVLGIPFHVLEATPFTNDAAILKNIASRIALPDRVHIIDHAITPGLSQALIGHCSMLLGMRLHALIMGFNQGVPGVALSRASKVNSIMDLFDLNDHCLPVGAQPDQIAQSLQSLWNQHQKIKDKIATTQPRLQSQAMKHTEIAIGLLSNLATHRFNFSQEFALHQTRLLFQADQTIEQLRTEHEQLRTEHEQLRTEHEQLRTEHEQLRSRIALEQEKHSSLQQENHMLKKRIDELEPIAKNISWLVDTTIYRYTIRFLSTWRQFGLKSALMIGMDVIKKRILRRQHAAEMNTLDYLDKAKMEEIVSTINSRNSKGIFVVTSAVVFKEFYNQRVINLAKYLAQNGWAVIYVAWRWSPNETMPDIYQEVHSNIFQVPVDIFQKHLETLNALTSPSKVFVIEFPHPNFFAAALKLRQQGFTLLYEIIDDWEEFHKVGQASWFKKDMERAFVINANLLSAVSPPLVAKFSDLRRDIHLIPNGYDPLLIGTENKNIARKNLELPKIHIGYFGHLTEAWFDWDFLLNILKLSRERGYDLHFHLIGYGAPDSVKGLEQYRNSITLHGIVEPQDLHKHAREWDVAIIPFRSGKLSEAVDPIKIYEYLYFGLPVIVKGISHLKDISPFVHVVQNESAFFDALRDIKNQVQNNLAAEENTALLKATTWEARFENLLTLLERGTWMSL